MNQRELFFRYLAQTTPNPLAIEIVKAEGCKLFGPKGEEYIDLISGISVSNIGHRHPKVIEAIHRQLDQYMHLMVYGEYVQEPQNLLAKALIEALGKPFESVYFVNSGAEANDGAFKISKRFTGRYEIISFKNSYHGSTQGVMGAYGDEYFKRNYRPLIPGHKLLEYNNFNQIEEICYRTAAVIIEPIQAESGIIAPFEGYLKAIRNRCNETGTLLIFDEVQTGFGRTGSLFAFQEADVIPDIITLAKGMGGGMPIGAFVTRKEIIDVISYNPILGHITTFGGHPICCAAALANLNVIRNEHLVNEAKRKAELIAKFFENSADIEIRQKGLMMAIQLSDFITNKKLIDLLIKNGILTDWFLFNSSAMRIAPPLNIPDDVLIHCLEKIKLFLNQDLS